MKIPTFLDLLDHEATPDWRTPTFWLGSRGAWFAPGLLFGLTFALYISLLLSLVGSGLFLLSGGETQGAVQSAAQFLSPRLADPWAAGGVILTLALYIFIAENVLRIALDTAAAKPFEAKNASRFFRAAGAAAILSAMHFLNVVLDSGFGARFAGGSASGVYASLLLAITFVSLASAFREGERLRREQDLTV